MKLWDCAPRARPYLPSLIPSDVSQFRSFCQVCPSCSLTVLKGSELVQLLLHADALAQANIVHAHSFDLHIIHWDHGWVMAFSQLQVPAVPLPLSVCTLEEQCRCNVQATQLML
jgi:hypothetical protein